ncbi:CotH kinase family protein [Portibacter lacus]|uniref:Secretion system C-terminal sorting domain-containing protein n=1 Tax=Portibacter lacus TaxID=1099794 RepID=A0AA37WEX2_9BACT|nr:CotH kinase family protein [Portibacter lacus]GLR19286.1 hypothetical protein GCM10007940_39020 [Portibacter lacus]
MTLKNIRNVLLLGGFSIFIFNFSAFAQVNLASSKLPIIIIDTEGQEIQDEPKINCKLKIIHHYGDKLNEITDEGNEYDGIGGIEYRGNYSATLPQKPYGLETRLEDGENNDVSLFGFPEENDWILLANYNDKVFFRNILAFHIFNKMGHYAPRTQLCEVILNDKYEGIYVFTEKIKRDKGRVDINNLKEDENEGDDLTGGYIFKIDYWNNEDSWQSDYTNPLYPNKSVHYVYDTPDYDEITDPQKAYLMDHVSAYEDVLWSQEFADSVQGYKKYIDLNSFIDYLIVNEVARNVDGFKKSRFFHKDKDSKDPLIKAGPIWDFDWAFKNHYYSNGAGWMYKFEGGVDVSPPGWYIRMMKDNAFVEQFRARYFELRENILSEAYLNSFIDSMAVQVEGAQERHYTRWPILGIKVGTPEYGNPPDTYEGEVANFKSWLKTRLEWLDGNMPSVTSGLWAEEKQPISVNVFPSPAADDISLSASVEIKNVSIYDLSGKLVRNISDVGRSELSVDIRGLQGIFFVRTELENGEIMSAKIICK